MQKALHILLKSITRNSLQQNLIKGNKINERKFNLTSKLTKYIQSLWSIYSNSWTIATSYQLLINQAHKHSITLTIRKCQRRWLFYKHNNHVVDVMMSEDILKDKSGDAQRVNFTTHQIPTSSRITWTMINQMSWNFEFIMIHGFQKILKTREITQKKKRSLGASIWTNYHVKVHRVLAGSVGWIKHTKGLHNFHKAEVKQIK